MTDKLEKRSEETHVTQFTPNQTSLLKRTVCKGATDDELYLFLHVAQRTGLDPFARQIHSIQRREKVDGEWQDTRTIQTGIDGYRLIAQRSGEYEGQTKPEWFDGGEWYDVWSDDEAPPVAARVGVYRKNFREPIMGVVRYEGYAQRKRDGEPMARWKTDPAGMLAKCAEALALRKAFPQELSGVYTDVEMEQANTPEAPRAAMPRRASAASQPATDAEEMIETAVVDVTKKTGQKKNGDTWTRYGIVCENGVTYGTFSETVADAARSVKGTGEVVALFYTDDGKYKTATGIVPGGQETIDL